MHLFEWVLRPKLHTVCSPHLQGLLQGAELAPVNDVTLELHLHDMSTASFATVLAGPRMLYTHARNQPKSHVSIRMLLVATGVAHGTAPHLVPSFAGMCNEGEFPRLPHVIVQEGPQPLRTRRQPPAAIQAQPE